MRSDPRTFHSILERNLFQSGARYLPLFASVTTCGRNSFEVHDVDGHMQYRRCTAARWRSESARVVSLRACRLKMAFASQHARRTKSLPMMNFRAGSR